MFLIFNYELDLYRFTPPPLAGILQKPIGAPYVKNGQAINGNPIRLTLFKHDLYAFAHLHIIDFPHMIAQSPFAPILLS